MTRITCSIDEPIRDHIRTPDERFGGPDRGLIFCWEQGRQMAAEQHRLQKRAARRELPQLETWRRGTLNYYALWLGLRGEDLDIDRDEGFAVQCSKTMKWWAFGPEGEWKTKLQLWLNNRHLEFKKKDKADD